MKEILKFLDKANKTVEEGKEELMLCEGGKIFCGEQYAKRIEMLIFQEDYKIFEKIKNYMTNSQAENRTLNEKLNLSCKINEWFGNNEDVGERLREYLEVTNTDYKSRCEKAIEYIKKHPTKTWYYLKKNHNKKINPNTDLILCQVELSNILQGSDKE